RPRVPAVGAASAGTPKRPDGAQHPPRPQPPRQRRRLAAGRHRGPPHRGHQRLRPQPQRPDGRSLPPATAGHPGPHHPGDGARPDGLAVSGSDASRVFHDLAGETVTLTGVTDANGKAATGGGIDNAGSLTVRDSELSDNQAVVVLSPDLGGGGILNEVGATL